MRILLLLIPISFVLSACPYESTVPLEPHPVEPVDSTLLGYWYGIVKDGSDFFGIEALDITQRSDSTYSIIRYGKAAKGDIILPDTAYFTGYISYIGDDRFMNIEGTVVIAETKGRNKPPVIKTNKIFYIANFNMRNDTLSMRTVTENFSPNRTIFNTGVQLKQAIIDLTDQKKNIYDDLYTLQYRKIPRPQPMKPF